MADEMKWKHCNDCMKHWVVDDYDDDYITKDGGKNVCGGGMEFGCGSDDISDCTSETCRLMSELEESAPDNVYAYPVNREKIKSEDGAEREKISLTVSSSGAGGGLKEAELGVRNTDGWLLLGFGEKDDGDVKYGSGKTAFWITPQNKLRVNSGAKFVNTCGGIEERGPALSTFKNAYPKGNTELSNYANALKIFEDFNNAHGFTTIMWSEAKAYVRDFKEAPKGVKVGGGNKRSSTAEEIRLLREQNAMLLNHFAALEKNQ